MIIVKTWAVDLEEQKPYCLSLKYAFVEVFHNFLVYDSDKTFINDTKEADGVILWWGFTCNLEHGHTLHIPSIWETFFLEVYFWLTNFNWVEKNASKVPASFLLSKHWGWEILPTMKIVIWNPLYQRLNTDLGALMRDKY